MEPITKKTKFVESTVSEPSIHQPVASLNKFPPEMLEIIFGNSTTTDLLDLRQVSRQWNDVSSRVLRGRYDMPIHFILSGFVYIKKSRHRCRQCSLNLREPTCTLGARTLTDLVAFLTKSPLFPGTSFRFDDLSNESCEGLTSFLGIWGSRVSSLKVSTSDSGENVKTLLKQLLRRISNLKNLKFSFEWDILPPVSTSISSSTLTMSDSQFQLPKLESFCVSDSHKRYSQIIEEILTASPNLKRFSIADRTVSPEDLEMLHKSNKLHCLQDLKIHVTEDLINYWKKSPSRFELQLRSLTLSIHKTIYFDNELNISASDMINQLLVSNKNTIETLDTRPITFSQIVFPKFERMQKLRLQPDNVNSLYIVFPLSIDWFNTFPNMKKLETTFFNGAYDVLLARSLKALPNIEILQLSLGRNTTAFEDLIKRTPNVKTLIIRDDHTFWCENVQNLNFEEIATYLPKLETFCWQLRNYVSLRYKIDALITGLPVDFCKEKAVELRDEDSLNATEVSRYRLQCNPSILDLKELRNLHINFTRSSFYQISEDDDNDSDDGSMNRDKAGFDSSSVFYKTGFTKVSKLLAFDQMPNLKIAIHMTKSPLMSEVD